MKKLRPKRSANATRGIIDSDLGTTRPLRVAGATVTAVPEPLDTDLVSLPAGPVVGDTVAGAGSATVTAAGSASALDQPDAADHRHRAAVLLSDGTQITFATTAPIEPDDPL